MDMWNRIRRQTVNKAHDNSHNGIVTSLDIGLAANEISHSLNRADLAVVLQSYPVLMSHAPEDGVKPDDNLTSVARRVIDEALDIAVHGEYGLDTTNLRR